VLNAPQIPSTLGADIRAIRTAKSVRLMALAQKLGRSVGWLSQVERDLSQPSFEDLRDIADALDVPVSLFFGEPTAPEDERGLIVRHNQRRKIGSREGLTETLISPDLTDNFEVVHSVFAPGASNQITQRATQEIGYILSGTLHIWIDGKDFTVTDGDSFRIRNQPYRWHNTTKTPVVALWVISPPTY
jgi:transcriptional regulator with XRE-family HTH domain